MGKENAKCCCGSDTLKNICDITCIYTFLGGMGKVPFPKTKTELSKREEKRSGWFSI
jgi:hypothetical protein